MLDLGDAQIRSIELAACLAMAVYLLGHARRRGLDLYGLMSGAIVLGNSRLAGDLWLDVATRPDSRARVSSWTGMVDLTLLRAVTRRPLPGAEGHLSRHPV